MGQDIARGAGKTKQDSSLPHTGSLDFVPLAVLFASANASDLEQAWQGSVKGAEKREQWRFVLEQWHMLATNYFSSREHIVVASGSTNLALDDGSLAWLKILVTCHATEAKLPSSTLGLAMTLRSGEATFNDTGTMTVDPGDYPRLVTGMAAQHGTASIMSGRLRMSSKFCDLWYENTGYWGQSATTVSVWMGYIGKPQHICSSRRTSSTLCIRSKATRFQSFVGPEMKE